MTRITLNILQIIILIALAPLASGVITKIKNNLRLRRGAGILQPYLNLGKLFSKEEEVVSIHASWIFKVAPFIVFASSILACLIVPAFIPNIQGNIGDLLSLIFILGLGRFFLALSGLDTGSSFGGMGSSRETFISSLAEPVVLLSFFVVSLNLGTTNLSAGVSSVKISTVLAAISLMLVVLAETSRIPIDNQETHLELTMIHEAMILEYSGRSLALIELSSYIKQIVLFSLVSALLPVKFFQVAGVNQISLEFAIYLAKISIICVIVAFVEVSLAKMRLFRAADFLSFSFALALIAMISAALGV